MSKVKNISGGHRYVSFLGRGVDDGEIVEVPDVQADGESAIVWPEATWQPVTDKDAKAAASADGTDGKAAE